MASVPVEMNENFGAGQGDGNGSGGANGHFLRVIVADTQAIFRAGLRKIFALEDDIRVVGQAETLAQAQSAVKKFSSDVVIFEAALAQNPVEAVADLLRQNPEVRFVVVTRDANEELTLELFRRGAHGVVSRDVEPELLLDCLRKVAAGETWLESRAIRWVMEAFRNQSTRPAGAKPKVQLTPKESLIVSCVTQGMKNKEIALRVGTTEQVVKNYLRKVYDKLGVADRLELALYCLNHHVVDNTKVPPLPVSSASASTTTVSAANGSASTTPSNNSSAMAAAAGATSHSATPGTLPSTVEGKADPDKTS